MGTSIEFVSYCCLKIVYILIMLNWFMVLFRYTKALLVAQLVKHLLQCGRDLGSIPGSGSFPGEGNGKPLQYSRLEKPMDRGAWQATIHGVTRVGHDLMLSFSQVCYIFLLFYIFILLIFEILILKLQLKILLYQKNNCNT